MSKITVERVKGVVLHKADGEIELVEIAVFTAGQQALPIIFQGVTPEKQDEIVANTFIQLEKMGRDNAKRDTLQTASPAALKSVPGPVPN